MWLPMQMNLETASRCHAKGLLYLPAPAPFQHCESFVIKGTKEKAMHTKSVWPEKVLPAGSRQYFLLSVCFFSFLYKHTN